MVPLQRPDVQTFVDPRGLIVYDPHTGLRVLLGPESTLLWDALAGGVGSPSALIHATPELSDAQRFVRLMQLDQALLLVSPRWRRQEHLFHARAQAVDSPLYVHPRLTHECVKCGSSCQEIHVGPITPLTATAIKTNELWRSDPNAKQAEDILASVQVNKKSVLMLKQVDGHCAVWSHDRSCTIHATSGYKLKPLACQQYPYTMIRTSKGVYVGLDMTCRSLPQSLEAGASYRPTEIAQRLAPIVMSGGQTHTLPAPAPLSAGSYIPESALEEWWKWSVLVVEQALSELELSDRDYSISETWRKVFEKLTLYVHEWLLRIDEPETSTQWLDSQTWLFQSSLPTREEVKLSFLDELQHALLEASMQHQRDQSWQEMKRLERLYDAVEVWSGRWPLPRPRWRGDRADKLMNLAILEGVYSNRLFLQGDLIYGLAHLQLTLELVDSLMRLSAHLSSRMVIETAEVNDALVLVNRALREPVVDTTLKRWAGGLRWLMSPDGMPYRHSLGTLEPHLFKLQTHFARTRQASDEASRAGAAVATALAEQRIQASEDALQTAAESGQRERSDQTTEVQLEGEVGVGKLEGRGGEADESSSGGDLNSDSSSNSDLKQGAGAAHTSGELERGESRGREALNDHEEKPRDAAMSERPPESRKSSLIMPEQVDPDVVRAVNWVESVGVHSVSASSLSSSTAERGASSLTRESNASGPPSVATPPDPYPELEMTTAERALLERRRSGMAEPDDAEAPLPEDTIPRLRAAPRGSLMSAPQRKRSAAPYDQAAGLRAAQRSRKSESSSSEGSSSEGSSSEGSSSE